MPVFHRSRGQDALGTAGETLALLNAELRAGEGTRPYVGRLVC